MKTASSALYNSPQTARTGRELDSSAKTESPSCIMLRFLPALLSACILCPSLVAADAPEHDAEWLTALRNSGTYRQGLEQASAKIEHAYDLGAVNGATKWDTIHQFYVELASAKGCEKGTQFADGPVEACRKVSTAEPKLLGATYKTGKMALLEISRAAAYSELVGRVLLVIYDFGYVQGMKHASRAHNAQLRWAQTYYQSCVARANDAMHEPTCARASTKWADALISKLHAQVEAHGLPTGKEPK